LQSHIFYTATEKITGYLRTSHSTDYVNGIDCQTAL